MNTTEIKYLPLKWLVEATSLLPLWMLYRISDLAFLMLYYCIGYRREVVRRNLAGSYPDIPQKELNRIERQFYRNFTDYIFETIKLLHISDKQMQQRMTFDGVEIIDRYLRQGRHVVAYFSHCGNWEWATSITNWSTLESGKEAMFCQIYRPLRNKWFDNFMLRIRSRFRSISLPKRVAFLDLMRFKKQGIPSVTGFMSDQKPSHGDQIHAIRFLNRPTAMITGTETVARRLDAAVVYWDMTKPSRGHYHISIRLITDEPRKLPEYAITDRYASLLQQTVNRDPAIWLWSHNRWKHPVEIRENSIPT